MPPKKTDFKNKVDDKNTDGDVISQTSFSTPSTTSILIKSTLLALVFVIIMLLITAFIVGLSYWRKFEIFAKSADMTPSNVIEMIKTGWNEEVVSDNSKKNILILGVDTMENRGNAPPLTDTIMIASINLDQGIVNTLSFPRDLWIEDYQTKINALYYYGQEKYPESPQQFPTEVISDLVSLPIHHTIVIDLNKLENLIDLVGGVNIDINEPFTDEQFPRSDVDVTVVRDPKLLYETVVFEQGPELMSGERALKYIRSRYSQGNQGTDLARSRRQQQVIEALLTNLLDLDQFLQNPEKLGAIFSFYEKNFAEFLPTTQLIALSKSLYPMINNFKIEKKHLTTQPDDPDGVIVNPPTSKKYQNQWVYIISNQERFDEEIEAIFR